MDVFQPLDLRIVSGQCCGLSPADGRRTRTRARPDSCVVPPFPILDIDPSGFSRSSQWCCTYSVFPARGGSDDECRTPRRWRHPLESASDYGPSPSAQVNRPRGFRQRCIPTSAGEMSWFAPRFRVLFQRFELFLDFSAAVEGVRLGSRDGTLQPFLPCKINLNGRQTRLHHRAQPADWGSRSSFARLPTCNGRSCACRP